MTFVTSNVNSFSIAHSFNIFHIFTLEVEPEFKVTEVYYQQSPDEGSLERLDAAPQQHSRNVSLLFKASMHTSMAQKDYILASMPHSKECWVKSLLYTTPFCLYPAL